MIKGLPHNLLFLFLLWLLFSGGALHSQKNVTTLPQIEELLHFLKKSLQETQQDDGSWLYKDLKHYQVGMTALAVLALSHAGLPSTHPQIQKALTYLLQNKSEYTYCLSLTLSAFAQINPLTYQTQIQELAKQLLKSQSPDGGFTYYNSGGESDSSNTQFGAIGLYEALRCGVKIPPHVWSNLLLFLDQVRDPFSGGYGYKISNNRFATPSMTSACLATLHIAQGMTFKENTCGIWEGREKETAALHWLSLYFQGKALLPQNAQGRIEHHEFYFLYALERCAHLMGIRELDGWDWFYQGLQLLLQRYHEGKLNEPQNQAFALLFLSKGRTPLLMGQILDHPTSDSDPHAIEKLVFSASAQLKKPLAYQKVHLADDLSSIPILWMSGHSAFEYSPEQVTSLKNYLRAGGLLVGSACCNRREFAESFRNLTSQLLEGKSSLEPLAGNHPLYHLKDRTLPPPYRIWYGAGYLCKTSILFSSKGLSCHWQKGREESIEFELSLNLIRFALSENPVQDRLAPPPPSPWEASAFLQGPLLIAKLQHQSDWNNDPEDLQGLLSLYYKETGKTARFFFVSAEEKEFPAVPLLYLNGHQAPQFSDFQKKALKHYLDEGGILFAEACCDKTEFSLGFQKTLQELYPQLSLERLPPEHFLYHGGSSTPEPPPLYQLKMGCRASVFLSTQDLSCHWDPRCPWCKNNLEGWAIRIGINLLESVQTPQESPEETLQILQKQAPLVEKKTPPLYEALPFAQIIHSGDFNSDPLMMEKLIQHFHQHLGLSLYRTPSFVHLDQDDLFQFPFLYLTGHHLGNFTEEELFALRRYLQRGGALIADACCGSDPFKHSFLLFFHKLFPEEQLLPLSPSHPLLQSLSLETRPGIPLEMPLLLEKEERLWIFFSPLDLGCAIQGHPCPQCRGFTRNTSQNLFRNLFHYLMTH
jgi:hypothetical protein